MKQILNKTQGWWWANLDLQFFAAIPYFLQMMLQNGKKQFNLNVCRKEKLR